MTPLFEDLQESLNQAIDFEKGYDKAKETGKNAAYDTFVQPNEIGVLIEKKRIGTGNC